MPHIEVDRLTKRYGALTAVDDLSFALEPGSITGFVGANGAGKSTTLRMLLGLTRPTSGTATVDGHRYEDLPNPARTVGALTDPDVFHPGRSGRNALRVLARASRVGDRRVDELIEVVDLTGAARRRVGGYSTGMRQRLGLAAALLGDPPVLILDEPANGLDPMGVAWLRGLLRGLAGEGRTVLVSSHQLAELSRTVDDVILIDHGRMVARGSTADLMARHRSESLEQLFLDLVADGAPVMTALLAAERLKLRTLRLPWIITAVAVALSGIIGVVQVRIANDAGGSVHLSAVALAPAQAMWFLAIVVAVLASAGEFQHRTIRTTLLAAPSRGRVLAAKSVVAAAYGAALVLLGATVAVVAALVTAAASGTQVVGAATGWGHVAAGAAVGAVFAVLATGIGVITRSTAATIGAILLWRFVGEGMLPVLLRDDGLTRWTPTGAASGLLGLGAHPLPPSGAALTLAGYTATVCVLATALFLRRDPT